jgi:hypothetical protein
VAAPELASARKRIKARFTQTPEPIRLFFPPKWGLNTMLPQAEVLGAPSHNAEPTTLTQATLF